MTDQTQPVADRLENSRRIVQAAAASLAGKTDGQVAANIANWFEHISDPRTQQAENPLRHLETIASKERVDANLGPIAARLWHGVVAHLIGNKDALAAVNEYGSLPNVVSQASAQISVGLVAEAIAPKRDSGILSMQEAHIRADGILPEQLATAQATPAGPNVFTAWAAVRGRKFPFPDQGRQTYAQAAALENGLAGYCLRHHEFAAGLKALGEEKLGQYGELVQRLEDAHAFWDKSSALTPGQRVALDRIEALAAKWARQESREVGEKKTLVKRQMQARMADLEKEAGGASTPLEDLNALAGLDSQKFIAVAHIPAVRDVLTQAIASFAVFSAQNSSAPGIDQFSALQKHIGSEVNLAHAALELETLPSGENQAHYRHMAVQSSLRAVDAILDAGETLGRDGSAHLNAWLDGAVAAKAAEAQNDESTRGLTKQLESQFEAVSAVMTRHEAAQAALQGDNSVEAGD